MQSTGDIQIPQPNTGTSGQNASVPQQATTGASQPAAEPGSGMSDLISLVGQNESRNLSGNQVIIGVVVSLLLVVLFWFIGRIVADTLIKQFAEVGAAKRAGLALTAFLSVVGGVVTFGILGNFWLMPVFFAPAGALTALLFFAFLFSFIGANRSKRK